MNRSTLRQQFRIAAGLGDGNTKADERLNTLLNLCLRKLWADVPDELLAEEWAFHMQVPVECAVTSDLTDSRVLEVTDTTTIPTDGTWRGRWLDGLVGTRYYEVRIRDIVVDGGTTYIVTDQQWPGGKDVSFTARLFCKEYPYPADVQAILDVMRDPDESDADHFDLLTMQELRGYLSALGTRQLGIPERIARGSGNLYLDAPRDTPVAAPNTADAVNKWGYLGANHHGVGTATIYQPLFEPAGTFEYRYCYVWGRRPGPSRIRHLGSNDDGADPGNDTYLERTLEPFLLSEPSAPTAAATTTWGGDPIQITSEDPGVELGFSGFTFPCDNVPVPPPEQYSTTVLVNVRLGEENNADIAHEAHGLEKWWFKRRTATQAPISEGARPANQAVTADGVWKLWRIAPASETSFQDVGQGFVDPYFRLKDFHSVQSLRFDRLPTQEHRVLMQVKRRPPLPEHDQDAMLLPPEMIDGLFDLLHLAYAQRDKSNDEIVLHSQKYDLWLRKLRQRYARTGWQDTAFGPSASSFRGHRRRFTHGKVRSE